MEEPLTTWEDSEDNLRVNQRNEAVFKIFINNLIKDFSGKDSYDAQKRHLKPHNQAS